MPLKGHVGDIDHLFPKFWALQVLDSAVIESWLKRQDADDDSHVHDLKSCSSEASFFRGSFDAPGASGT